MEAIPQISIKDSLDINQWIIQKPGFFLPGRILRDRKTRHLNIVFFYDAFNAGITGGVAPLKGFLAGVNRTRMQGSSQQGGKSNSASEKVAGDHVESSGSIRAIF